jgi:GTP-binding protein
MGEDWKTPTGTITPLLDAIVKYIPAPKQLEGTPVKTKESRKKGKTIS